jgi:transcriptional regulator with XRE-family HTH domain
MERSTEVGLQTAFIRRAKKKPKTIRSARLREGFSQAQMAHLAGTTQSTYSRIESGFIEKPDEDLLKRIAEILTVPADQLLVNESSEALPPKAEQTEATLNPKDIPEMLRNLKGLLDDRVITEGEFIGKKRELLGRL